MKQTDADLLRLGLGRFERKLTAQLRDQLQSEFVQWRRKQRAEARMRLLSVPRFARRQYVQEDTQDRRRSKHLPSRQLLDFLLATIPGRVESLELLRLGHQDFRQTYSLAVSEEECRRLVLEYARRLGTSAAQARRDMAALDRWFGEAAVTQRFRRRLGRGEQMVEFATRRLGVLFSFVANLLQDHEVPALWQRTRIESVFQTVLRYDGDVRLKRAVFLALADSLADVSSDVALQVVSPDLQHQAIAQAREARADTWLQTAALQVLVKINPPAADSVIQDRLGDPQPGDDAFFRRKAVLCLAQRIRDNPRMVDALRLVARDPSPFVRQQLATLLWTVPRRAARYYLPLLMREDESAQVRAATLAAVLGQPPRRGDSPRTVGETGEQDVPAPDRLLEFLHEMARLLSEETDPFVLRTSLHVATKLLESLAGDDGLRGPLAREDICSCYRQQLLPAIRNLQVSAEATPLRRWAAAAAESIAALLDDESLQILRELKQWVTKIRPGRSRWISRKRLGTHNEVVIGRLLAILAEEDYGFDLRRTWRGYWVTRPPIFVGRVWRVVHELLNPSTDKRQAFRHTIGRSSQATIRVPSRVLAELSQTKVPGEPLYLPEEGGWRPYLPLPDDFLSVLETGWLRARRVRFFTSEGVTQVDPPRQLWKAVWAWLRLTVAFSKYSHLRNWTSGSDSGPSEYLHAMTRLGFAIRFSGYDPSAGCRQPEGPATATAPREDASVTRFFPCLLAVGFAQVLSELQRFADYFQSVYENSLPELIAFTSCFLVLFLIKHYVANLNLRRARQRIPLSIGGWGTRGKSGTERLKAALITGMGFSMVSKTTGCEAMFLWGETYGATRELPLFRPLDKATIWEQRNVMHMAARLESTVYLWECMGLTPSYVDVLQRQWTRDDLATITNAYPDHEDLQGPAGWNVATTIAGFTPRRSRLLTTEHQMLPIIASACREVQTSLRHVTWLQSGLLTGDVLDRFAYREHPDNITLVAAMAEELGVDRDFALKEMADHLIADLGVLRTYPMAKVGTKRLEFTNGMSANERLGCVGNWERTGFASHEPAQEPGIRISTLVNNRADRVARSRVFASILVEDLSVDQHFVIGNNLDGFMGFVWRAWDERIAKFSPWNDRASATDVWLRQSRQMRQATCDEDVRRGVSAMLRGIDQQQPHRGKLEDLSRHALLPEVLHQALSDAEVSPEIISHVLDHQTWLVRSLREYREITERIESAGEADREVVSDACRRLLRTWFERKFVIIEDYHATGEEIIERMVTQTPPGFVNRVMGLQNIKGTGLGFVYEWQAWLEVHRLCQLVQQPDSAPALAAAEVLMGYRTFGPLARHEVRVTLEKLKQDPNLQGAAAIMDFERLERRLAESAARSPRPGATSRAGAFWSWLEDLLDAGDSVKRRRLADRVYRDLQDEQISVDDAITEIRRLNTRQKGGWLEKRLRQWWPAPKSPRESDAEYAERMEQEADSPRKGPARTDHEPVGAS